ncbi:glycosyltransferase [Lentzea sp. NPDC005914]|uniref:glycosyltransferase n=1 Tax=Lentzea sp. NPDC005914 TaxID=3154572 RepID=UPI0033C9D8CB
MLGIPHALVDIAPFAPLEIEHLDERKDKVRARFGVSGTEPSFTAGLMPPYWHPAERHYRVPIDETRTEGAPEIVATFGTNAGLLLSGSKLLHIVAEALGQVLARAVLAIGEGEWTGPRPANVELRPEVPQQQLLNTAKVFVTHAGYSSVRESLTAGVPMVAVPLFADQPRNAAKVEELKAGVSVEVKGLIAGALAEKIKNVLDAKTYHNAAETLAAEMAELPVFTTIPDHLVSAV